MKIELKVDEHTEVVATDEEPDKKEDRGSMLVFLLKAATELMESELAKDPVEVSDPPIFRITGAAPISQESAEGKKTASEADTTSCPRCPRCKDSPKGCECYKDGICKGVVYLTYPHPPQYDPCVFQAPTAKA